MVPCVSCAEGALNAMTSSLPGQSVQEIDLPEELAVHSTTKVTIDGAVAELRQQFPNMFKPSQNCRAPHLNEEVLRNELFQQKVVEELGCDGSAELVSKILAYNASLKAKKPGEWPVKVQGKVYKKAEANGLLLGLVQPARIGWVSSLLAARASSTAV